MRRMLDPKTIGGDNKIYLHCIQIYGSGFGSVYTICYTSNQDKFTINSFQQFMKGKILPCTGKLSGTEKRMVAYLEFNKYNNYVELWYYDLDNPSSYHPISIASAKIEDLVSQL